MAMGEPRMFGKLFLSCSRTSQLFSVFLKFFVLTLSLFLSRGIGVIGEQPVILPSTGFEYSSACPLSTPSGRMVRNFFHLTNEEILFCFVVCIWSA